MIPVIYAICCFVFLFFLAKVLKQKQNKYCRFTQFIQEAESHPQCCWLQLKDIIPFEMQRLSKSDFLLHLS